MSLAPCLTFLAKHFDFTESQVLIPRLLYSHISATNPASTPQTLCASFPDTAPVVGTESYTSQVLSRLWPDVCYEDLEVAQAIPWKV
jgi:hypothetical protein